MLVVAGRVPAIGAAVGYPSIVEARLEPAHDALVRRRLDGAADRRSRP
jgi:hypothetical protein